MVTKPKLFIASSAESISIAHAIQQNLQSVAEVTVWDQGFFRPSSFTMESLVTQLENLDFGAFLFSPEDITTIREKEHTAVRDNVIFELGLFIGRLGRERCFILIPDKNQDLRIPTDLTGITFATYETERSDGNWRAATGPACSDIRKEIDRLGFYSPHARHAEGMPSPPTDPESKASRPPTSVSAATEMAKEPIESIEKKKTWFDAVMANENSEAIRLIEVEIEQESELDKKIELACWKAVIHASIDIRLGSAEYESLIAKYPHHNQPYVQYAYSYIAAGFFDEARAVLDRGLEKVENSEPLILAKAKSFSDEGRYDEAGQLLEDAIASKDQQGTAVFYAALIDTWIAKGDEQKTLTTINHAISIFPLNESLLLKQANLSYNFGNYREALRIYRKLNQMNPLSPQYLTLIGNTYLELQLHGLALDVYLRANELSGSKEDWILANIGNVYNNRGFYGQAIKYLKDALAIAPESDYAQERLLMARKNYAAESSRLEVMLKADDPPKAAPLEAAEENSSE